MSKPAGSDCRSGRAGQRLVRRDQFDGRAGESGESRAPKMAACRIACGMLRASSTGSPECDSPHWQLLLLVEVTGSSVVMGSIYYTNYRDKWTGSFPTGGKHPFAGARARVGVSRSARAGDRQGVAGALSLHENTARGSPRGFGGGRVGLPRTRPRCGTGSACDSVPGRCVGAGRSADS